MQIRDNVSCSEGCLDCVYFTKHGSNSSCSIEAEGFVQFVLMLF